MRGPVSRRYFHSGWRREAGETPPWRSTRRNPAGRAACRPCPGREEEGRDPGPGAWGWETEELSAHLDVPARGREMWGMGGAARARGGIRRRRIGGCSLGISAVRSAQPRASLCSPRPRLAAPPAPRGSARAALTALGRPRGLRAVLLRLSRTGSCAPGPRALSCALSSASDSDDGKD